MGQKDLGITRVATVFDDVFLVRGGAVRGCLFSAYDLCRPGVVMLGSVRGGVGPCRGMFVRWSSCQLPGLVPSCVVRWIFSC